MARTLGFTGTPSWVAGNRILSGAVGYDALKEAVAQAREKSWRTCCPETDWRPSRSNKERTSPT